METNVEICGENEVINAKFSYVENAPCIIGIPSFGGDEEEFVECANLFYPSFSFLRFSHHRNGKCVEEIDVPSRVEDVIDIIKFIKNLSVSKIGVFGFSVGGLVGSKIIDKIDALCVYAAPIDSNVYIDIPLLILHGKNDAAVSVNYAHNLHKTNPSSDIYVFNNVGHSFPIIVGKKAFDWFKNLWENFD